ncbi:membrane protein containing DUF1295 [Trypanosoma conorhini]|uniref:Membrane protein containing DUF1295 n=1 Tax=Trypanosoma conorhini TaxID=83891 RepID=A0A422NVA2_9TRYP|nr:membrane protein containing DUF1295 [Trypanosoma conorhini]RNF09379.1 membrane protein containing DUF1295 [Trypanosoma conorhini]
MYPRLLSDSAAFLRDSLNSLPASSYDATLALMLVVALVMYAASVVHRNYSWVDRSWSIMPVVYAWIHIGYTLRAGTGHAALNSAPLMYGALITLWGARLTLNFARRGGYSRGHQDHRWTYIRSWRCMRNPLLWELFSFSAIAVFQTALLWGITLPVMNIPAVAVGGKDVLVGAAILALIFFETLCDEQQQRFQRGKHAAQARRRGGSADGQQSRTASPGFCITGVFGHSRHLNVFCEGCVWVAVALAALVHGGFVWWQWAGCATLQLLLRYSTARVTERLSREKYPAYALYQQTTPMLVPAVRSTTARTLFLLQQQRQQQQSRKST